MEKFRPYSAALRSEFRDYKAHILSGTDKGFGCAIAKLEQALAVDPLDVLQLSAESDSPIVVRMSSAAKKRKESKLWRINKNSGKVDSNGNSKSDIEGADASSNSSETLNNSSSSTSSA
jgi:hypothetical protein